MEKNKVILTESQLTDMIAKSVRRVIKEASGYELRKPLTDAMNAIKAKMSEIERSYEEAEEDFERDDFYNSLRNGVRALSEILEGVNGIPAAEEQPSKWYSGRRY